MLDAPTPTNVRRMSRRTSSNSPDPSRDPDPFDKNVGAADRLLEAVTRLLVERGSALVAGALKPEDVTARAGKSRASYYRTEGFPGADLATGDESRLTVLEAALRRALQQSAAGTDELERAIDDFIGTGWRSVTPAEFLVSAAADNFDITGGKELIEQLFAAALGASSDTIAADLREYYAHVTKVYASEYGRLLAFLGYRVRPPFTAEHMAIGLMALAEGLAMRAIADPSLDRAVYAQFIATFATGLVLAPGETTDPLESLYQMLPEGGTPPRRSEIIAALLRMFALDRWSLPTLDELAHRAGCSSAAITTCFGSVAGVARAAWDEWVPEFADAVSRDRMTLRESDSMTMLYRCATLVATRAAEHRAMTRALLMSDISTVEPRPNCSDPVVGLFESLLDEAVRAGEFSTPSAPGALETAGRTRLFALALRSMLLQVVATTPVPLGASPADHGRWCTDYVWSLMIPARRASHLSDM